MSSNEVLEKDKGGRPPEGIKFGQHKNAFGWDPVGNKQIKQEIIYNTNLVFSNTDNDDIIIPPPLPPKINRNTKSNILSNILFH